MKGKLVLNLLFIGAAVTAGVALGLKPWKVYGEQRRNADAYLRDAQKSENDRVELERQKNKYESSLGREELARKNGYKKPNESDLDLGG
jgi:hypothetical protein